MFRPGEIYLHFVDFCWVKMIHEHVFIWKFIAFINSRINVTNLVITQKKTQ